MTYNRIPRRDQRDWKPAEQRSVGGYERKREENKDHREFQGNRGQKRQREGYQGYRPKKQTAAMTRLESVERSAKRLKSALHATSNRHLMKQCGLQLEPVRTTAETRCYERRLRRRWRLEFEAEMRAKENKGRQNEGEGKEEEEEEKENERRESEDRRKKQEEEEDRLLDSDDADD